MTPERARLIREAWDRCGPFARRHFALEGGMAWRAEIPRDVTQIVPHTAPLDSARMVTEVFVFIHETARDRPFAPQCWRVVCEGLVVASGVYE